MAGNQAIKPDTKAAEYYPLSLTYQTNTPKS
jgi:hypothetical protein